MSETLYECSVEGCDRGGQMRRGMCGPHYERVRKLGQLESLPFRPGLPLTARLAARAVRQPNGCLEWTGRTMSKEGYGVIKIDGKSTLTHRVAWIIANGPIPDGLCVLHHCDNPPCIETAATDAYPDGHLFLGTRADNNADMVAKGRQYGVTHCAAGHEYTEANTYVSPAGVRDCRECRKARSLAYYHRNKS